MDRLIKKLSYTRIIAMSFILVILIGSVILHLPISSRSGEWTPFFNCLFTATSATCVTGLTVYDTYTQWSLFGQITILVMVQIGGLGLMSFITMFSIFTKRKITLHERKLLMQSSGNMRMSGVMKLLKRIIIGTFLLEGIGAIAFMFVFIPREGVLKGIYHSIFYAVIGFCNAGFDLTGEYQPFASFTLPEYRFNLPLNIILMCLIFVGGIGFGVWSDVMRNKQHFRRYSLQSKIILTSSVFLLVVGTVVYLFTEWNAALAGMDMGEKFLAATFLSVTSRTAGYVTVDMSTLSEAGSLFAVVLMCIGGAPASMAGGIKITTMMILVYAIICEAKGEHDVTIFKRRLEDDLVKQAAVIALIYVTAIITSTMLICMFEDFSLREILFETASAASTMGASMGITPYLSVPSKIIIMVLMFGGRIGGLSLFLFFGEKKKQGNIARPIEKVLIG